MTLFLTLTLLAMFVVFGVDVRQKRREYVKNRKHALKFIFFLLL